jgi:NB-ARC domain
VRGRLASSVVAAFASLTVTAGGIAASLMTSDQWPGWLQPYRRWGWWAVLVLALAAAGLAVWEARRQASAHSSTTTTTSVLATDSGAVGGRDLSITGGAGPTAGRDVVIHNHYPPSLPAAEPVAGARVRLLGASARLPADLAPLVGRDTQLAELRGFFTAPGQIDPRVAVVSGLPGVGKSALAVRLAHQLADGLGRPPLYADLGGLEAGRRDPAKVLGWFLHALQVSDEAMPEGLEERANLYQSLLADERALVVLDNAADADQIRLLLPEGPRCLAVVTSRSRLATLPGALLANLEVLSEPAAVELLGTLAGRERIAADPQAAREVARACGGLPLALQIAGARLRSRPTWTIATLAEELADRRRRLGRLNLENLDVPGQLCAQL